MVGYRIPKTRHGSTVAHYHRRVCLVEVEFGDGQTRPGSRSVGFHFLDVMAAMNRPGAYHSCTTCLYFRVVTLADRMSCRELELLNSPFKTFFVHRQRGSTKAHALTAGGLVWSHAR